MWERHLIRDRTLNLKHCPASLSGFLGETMATKNMKVVENVAFVTLVCSTVSELANCIGGGVGWGG